MPTGFDMWRCENPNARSRFGPPLSRPRHQMAKMSCPNIDKLRLLCLSSQRRAVRGVRGGLEFRDLRVGVQSDGLARRGAIAPRAGEDDIVKTTGRICALAIAGLIFSNAAAMACLFTTDCSPGSQCVKSSGQVLGMCTGGTFPGNRYDQKPYSSPFDPNCTVGKTCSFNVECGPGNHCAMGSGLYGVCVRP